jgi:Tat protein secretion system quality control protein TatD with DNase activity
MQITLDIPDNLPAAIVQQYISTIETQMRLISELALSKFASEPNITLKTKSTSFEKLLQIANECSTLPVLDSRSADEILGYDNSPCGLFGDENGD